MHKFKLTKQSSMALIIVFSMVLSLLSPTMTLFKASENDSVIKNLTIIPKKQESYKPGNSIMISADWELPEDNAEKMWEAGDTFELKIPAGLTPKDMPIELKDPKTGIIYGTGRYDASKQGFVFTFTDEIEGMKNRKGGFMLGFTVDEHDNDTATDVPLVFESDNQHTINLGTINVGQGSEVGIEDQYIPNGDPITEDLVQKGAMGAVDYSTGIVTWYLRVNYDGKHVGEINVQDKIGDHHVLIKDSVRVYERFTNGTNVYPAITGPDGEDKTDVTDSLLLTTHDKGFDVTVHTRDIGLDSNGKMVRSYYELEYKTQYDGTSDEQYVMLNNTIYGKAGDHERESEASAEYFASGWGSATNAQGYLTLKKIDSDTGEGLSGAEFRLVHGTYPDQAFTVTTDENGVAKVEGGMYGDKVLEGKYKVTEIKAPSGYQKLEEDKWVLVKFDDEIQSYEIVIENDKLPEETPELTQLTVEKQWDGLADDEEKPEILVELFEKGNKEPVRTAIFKNGRESFTFK